MNSKPFLVDTSDTGTILKFRLEGEISEKASFLPLPQGSSSKVIIDLDGVTHINSGGIRLWIVWMKDMMTKMPGAEIHLARVPYIFFRQIKAISGFVPPKTKVESVLAPFECHNCGTEVIDVLTDGEAFNTAESSLTIPDKKCPKCGGQMGLEDHTEEFLVHLLKR